ncbi:MAG: hypothetical protein OHK0053_31200 [Microscillaceae bacterium]
MERIIGKYGPPQSDLLIFCLAGMHGNEPAGVRALEEVFAHLYQQRPPVKGRFIGLRGNIPALSTQKRYLHEDFNRIWTEGNIRIAREGHAHSPEMKELKAVFEEMDAFMEHPYSQRIFLDLHTTSGENGTFIVAVDYPHSRNLLDKFPVPLILGLEEKLEGTAITYFRRQGFISFAFEGGLHQDPQSTPVLAWGIWNVLQESGFLSPVYMPDLSETRLHLRNKFASLPQLLSLDYLHRVRPGDGFVMRPGFKNFDKIHEGQHLADDRQGAVLAPSAGYLLMPLYQKEGDDGFFLVSPPKM